MALTRTMNDTDGIVLASLRSYLSAPVLTKKKREAPLKEFVGCSDETLAYWLNGKLPRGETLLRLWFFLESVGVLDRETIKLDPEIFSLAKLVAYRVLAIETVREALGVCRDNMLKVLLGRSGISKAKRAIARAVVQEHQKKLNEAIANWQAAQKVLVALPSSAPSSQIAETLSLDHKVVLRTLAHQILAVIPLAETVVSDAFTPDEREELRKLTTTNGCSHGVFKLSNVLNRLCGEEAREKYTS